jgi:hypothetical protein
MSSIKYSTELKPDAKLRRFVLCTGVIASLGGLFAVTTIDISLLNKVAVALTWCLLSAWHLLLIARRYKACSRLELDASGELRVFGTNDRCRTATIETGSVVLDYVAWLRFRTGDGTRHAELLGRNSAGTHEWRRFQVIWRHLGATA